MLLTTLAGMYELKPCEGAKVENLMLVSNSVKFDFCNIVKLTSHISYVMIMPPTEN